MIDFPIVDTHLHVWDPRKLRYPWLDSVPFLNKPYLLDDYKKLCGQIIVEKMVFVQAEVEFAQYKEEANWVSSLVEEDPRLSGIVPWAPLEKGDAVESELEALAANKLVKGIRRIIQFEPDLEFCLQPDFIKGVRLLKGTLINWSMSSFYRKPGTARRSCRGYPRRAILDPTNAAGVEFLHNPKGGKDLSVGPRCPGRDIPHGMPAGPTALPDTQILAALTFSN